MNRYDDQYRQDSDRGWRPARDESFERPTRGYGGSYERYETQMPGDNWRSFGQGGAGEPWQRDTGSYREPWEGRHQEEMPPFRGYAESGRPIGYRGAERFGGPDEGRRQWEYNRGYGSRDVYNEPAGREFRGRYGAMQRGYTGSAPAYADDFGRNARSEYGYDYGAEGRSYGGERFRPTGVSGSSATQPRWQGEARESDYNARWDRSAVDSYGLPYPGSSYANREASAGPHYGRGPRGYRRSDERIREDVSDRLTEHSWLDASELEVRVEQGIVTLTGSVDNRQQKRLAEDIAESVAGVNDVRNELRVHDHAATSSAPGGGASTGSAAQPSASTASQAGEREQQRATVANNRQASS